jgi:glycosyltransferase involved in cell wall biosynthesis
VCRPGPGPASGSACLCRAPGDAGALAAAVAKLAEDPALRTAQGEAGRQMMLGRSWPVTCDELIGHYRAVLGATGRLRAEVPA